MFPRKYGKQMTEEQFNKSVEKQMRHALKRDAKKIVKKSN